MKIIIGPITFDILQIIRACLPATIFICFCVGIFLGSLEMIPDSGLNSIGIALAVWLGLLLVYIVLGVIFTYLTARFFHRSFGMEDQHVQTKIALVSGIPFYAVSLLGLIGTVYGYTSGGASFTSLLAFIGFISISIGYLLLLRFFSKRLSAPALS